MLSMISVWIIVMYMCSYPSHCIDFNIVVVLVLVLQYNWGSYYINSYINQGQEYTVYKMPHELNKLPYKLEILQMIGLFIGVS